MVDLTTDKMQALFTEYSFKVMFNNIFVIKYAILFYFAFLNTCYLWLFFLFAHWSFKVRLATYKWKAQVGGQANDTFTHDTCREEDTDPAPQTSRNSLFRILSLQLVTGTECLMYCWWPDYTRLAVTWPHLVWWPDQWPDLTWCGVQASDLTSPRMVSRLVTWPHQEWCPG